MTTLPTITDYQQSILLLLYRFRFLNRHHIQQFLNHKHHSRIQHWLSDLSAKKYVCGRYSRTFGENTKPAVYSLATKAKYILMDIDGISPTFLKQVYKERYKSQTYIVHCLSVADLYFYLGTIFGTSSLQFFTRQDLRNYRSFPRPLPDAYVVVKTGSQERYFVEFLDGNMPRYAIRKRVSQYIEYFDDQTWQKAHGEPVPSVIFVCPDGKMQSFLERYLNDTLEEEGITGLPVYLVTKPMIDAGDSGWTKIQV